MRKAAGWSLELESAPALEAIRCANFADAPESQN
jgi:hypothetical protein